MWGRGTLRAHCTPNALGQGGGGQHERCQCPEIAAARSQRSAGTGVDEVAGGSGATGVKDKD